MDVNSKQVAGTHYRAPVQHWDFVLINGLDYLRGCASKYITRARKKGNGRQDLLKAQHYVEKLMSPECAAVLAAWPHMQGVSVLKFADANALDSNEIVMLHTLCHPIGTSRDAQLAAMQRLCDALGTVANAYQPHPHWLEGEPTGAYIDQDG
jgi:hypothetical protein